MKLACTYWPSIKTPVGRRFVASWDKLAERLSRPLEVADKLSIPGWAPVCFRGDRRLKANVDGVYALGVDFDELDVPFEELCGAFHTATIAHTTFSHTADAPHARAFLRLSRAVSAVEYERLWSFVADRMADAGQKVDPAAKDPSRLWFIPAVPPRREGSTARTFFHRTIEGPPLDVDAILASLPKEEIVRPPTAARSSTLPVVTVRDRARAYLASCDVAIAGQGGHATTFRVATKMVRGFDLDVGTAFELMACFWNPACQPPWSAGDLLRKLTEAASKGRMPVGSLRDAPRKRTGS